MLSNYADSYKGLQKEMRKNNNNHDALIDGNILIIQGQISWGKINLVSRVITASFFETLWAFFGNNTG